MQLLSVYYDNRGSQNDVCRSQNDVRESYNEVRASTKLFSLNLCLIWLRISKVCKFMKGGLVNNYNKLEANWI